MRIGKSDMHNYLLFLDDVRVPDRAVYCDCDGESIYVIPQPHTDSNWDIVRSYAQFVEHINKHGMPSVVSFDHDLCAEHYVEGWAGHIPRYDSYKEKTGYECLQWLIDYCKKLNAPLPKCYVHSFNPVGKINMFKLIKEYNSWTMVKG